jgi:hypothetical protein
VLANLGDLDPGDDAVRPATGPDRGERVGGFSVTAKPAEDSPTFARDPRLGPRVPVVLRRPRCQPLPAPSPGPPTEVRVGPLFPPRPRRLRLGQPGRLGLLDGEGRVEAVKRLLEAPLAGIGASKTRQVAAGNVTPGGRVRVSLDVGEETRQ